MGKVFVNRSTASPSPVKIDSKKLRESLGLHYNKEKFSKP